MNVPRGKFERYQQWYGSEIFNLHVACHGDYAELPVSLAHCFVEECSDDAAMHVAGRAFEAARNADTAYDAMVLIDEKPEAETGAVLLSTAEAVIQSAVLQGHELLRGHAAFRAS